MSNYSNFHLATCTKFSQVRVSDQRKGFRSVKAKQVLLLIFISLYITVYSRYWPFSLITACQSGAINGKHFEVTNTETPVQPSSPALCHGCQTTIASGDSTKLSICPVDHKVCASCIEPQVKAVLTGESKVSVICLALEKKVLKLYVLKLHNYLSPNNL